MEASAERIQDKMQVFDNFSQLKIGDQVLMKDHKRTGKNKLDPVYFPMVYRIIEAFKNSFKLMDEHGQIFKYRVNAASLQRYRQRLDEPVINIS
ncbi:hypothetical protein [Absidia glauca]|uniref:Uncharacterized protein n=1 Tax=Absidia glauca TaxID=4829 RepID=A0A163ISZ6_ABSGL|nr:hypothetical protein [Absidia glauca]